MSFLTAGTIMTNKLTATAWSGTTAYAPITIGSNATYSGSKLDKLDAGNRSSAVMQQRHAAIDGLDDFPTPPWATRALMTALAIPQVATLKAREPAANRGFMARVLCEYFRSVEASDIFDYGIGLDTRDYLKGPLPDMVDWTITNPPFKLAEAFIERALATSRQGVAMLTRTSFIEGATRYHNLFKTNPPTLMLQFSERVVMQQGKMLNPETPVPHWDKKKGDWVMRRPSTATSYCWLVWNKAHAGQKTELGWVPPSRRQLTKPHDYDL